MLIAAGNLCRGRRFFRVAVVLFCLASPALSRAQGGQNLAPELRAKIDRIAENALAQTGVPSAAVAVVKDGQIAYVRAYGQATLQPPTPARPAAILTAPARRSWKGAS